jgi:hypothetical protein
MVQTFAITEYIDSLAKAEETFGLLQSADPTFFAEWSGQLPELNTSDRIRVDLIKQRYLYHRQYGHMLEGAVNFIVVAPLLEMAGFYDPPFHLRSEASVQLEIAAEEGRIYQGRIDALIVQEHLWVVLVESKRTSFNVEVALPQALAYMATSAHSERPTYGLVSNGAYAMFIKLQQSQYQFSEDFSLNRRRNELCNVLQVLNHLKTLV